MSGFYFSLIGRIEKADFPHFDNLYCKYCFNYGPDWEVTTVSIKLNRGFIVPKTPKHYHILLGLKNGLVLPVIIFFFLKVNLTHKLAP